MNQRSKTMRAVLLSGLLALVLAGTAVLFGVLGSGAKTPALEGGAVVTPGAGNGIRLLSVKLSPKDYAANGISPLAETAYSLTATITPMTPPTRPWIGPSPSSIPKAPGRRARP